MKILSPRSGRNNLEYLKIMKVALVHDYFNQYGGGERVVEAMADIWPDSLVYTSIYDKKLMRNWLKIDNKRIKTNFIQKLPFVNYLNKHYFFAYPLAFKYQNVGDVDIVLSSSSYAAKFAGVNKKSISICYLHTPPRFLWGYDTELSSYYNRPFDTALNPIYRLVVPPIRNILRRMDYQAAQRINFFIANSKEVQKRIEKHYNKKSEVIYPPVDTKKFKNEKVKDEGYFLIVSRLGGYKRVDIAVEAFNKLGLELRIVGVGPQSAYLKSIAKKNVKLLGILPDREVNRLLQNCTALIFPTHEDFGIVPVEAMAAGKPVIAFRGGGALETIIEGKTGEFFEKQTSESLFEVVKRFDPTRYNPIESKNQANKFSKEVFKQKIKTFVEEKMERY